MPEGSRNEWREFRASPRAELEAACPRPRRPAGPLRPAPRLGSALEWAAAIVAGLRTVAVSVGTGSWLRAVLAFILGTGVSVLAILRLAPKEGG
jgi:hypothetical protein